MKLEIYEPKDEKKKEEPVRLRLKKFKDGDIALEIVDENDKEADVLLHISSSDGVIEIWSGVSSDLGFQLDEVGHIKTREI